MSQELQVPLPALREWKIGPHTVIFEPPELLRLIYQGNLTLEQARALVEIYRELVRTRPVDILGDMSAADPLAPEVQRYLGETLRTEWFRISVYFGARLVHKALIKGVAIATHLATSASPPTEVLMSGIHYAGTREEAERLLHELRARLPPQEG